MRQWFDSKLFPSVSLYPDGRIQVVNERFKSMFLLNDVPIDGFPFSGLLLSHEVDLMMRSIVNLNQNPGLLLSISLNMPTIKDTVEIIEWEFLSHCNNKGQIIEITAIGRIKNHSIEWPDDLNAYVYHQRYLDSLVDMLFVVDWEGKISKVNQRFERYYQVKRVHCLGVKLDYHTIVGMNIELLSTLFECIQNRKSDQIIISDFHGLVTFNCKLVIIEEGVLVLCRDITTKQKNRIAIKQSKDKLDAILNSTTDSNLLIAPDKRILSFNKVAETEMRIVFNRELTYGSSIEDYILPVMLNNFRANFEIALSGETVVKEIQLHLEDYSSWYEIKYQPVINKNGEKLGVSFNSRYIDHFKKLIIQLSLRNELLNAVFNSSKSSLLILDFQGTIQYFNQAAEWLYLSLSGEKLCEGIPFIKLLPANYHLVCQSKWEAGLKGQFSSIFIELESLRHGPQQYQMQFHPVRDNLDMVFGVGIVLINRTQHHLQQQRISDQNKMLSQVAKICKEEWPTPIAHIKQLEAQIRNSPGSITAVLPDLLHHALKLDAMIHEVNTMIAKVASEITE